MSERRRPPPYAGSASAPPTENTPQRLRQPDSPGTPLAPRFAPQDLLAGRYRIRRFLARGGMGEVYEAVDRDLGIAVALKTLRPEVAAPLHRKEVTRATVRALVGRVYDEGGGSYKAVARIFGIERDHRRLLDFLRNNRLRVGD